MGNAIGQNRERIARHEMALDDAGVEDRRALIIDIGGADINADILSVQMRGKHARILEGLPDQLQQQPLLRVRLRSLAGGKAKGNGIELKGIVQIAASETIGEARRWRAFSQEPLNAPSSDGPPADDVLLLDQQPPEFVQ